MSRLVVEAVSGESRFMDVIFHLELFVSVSDAITGAPISGLLPDHFRVCAPSGKIFDTNISASVEAAWARSGGEPSGCYALGISIAKDGSQPKVEWTEGEYYPFGVQVRYTDEQNEVHAGQTVVLIQSLGK
jgi:hypothetical protein